ncbi:hypothetical protein [Serratia rubidaea]|uniref:hypothetical protein n=1 Tax=Serratia rubidaea TaxID=61652 RepID=UPI00242D2E49|nr:hypothetical protein [Serratia rubidaea]MCR0998772.1 hypothetical protein [Serratia rubidaea]
MPIELNKIPEKRSLPEPPNKLRWALIVILITLIAGGCSLYFWPKEVSTHSSWFWFSTLVAPFLTGSVCYAARLRYYENKRDAIIWWNQLHQERYDELVLYGQRAAGILGKAYMTPGICNKLAAALIQGNCMLQSHFSSRLQKTVISAQLAPPLNEVTQRGYQQRVAHFLSDVIKMLQPELSALTEPVSVRLRHDGTLDNVQMLAVWQRIFPAEYSGGEIDVIAEDDGLIWLDSWLDRSKAELLLSVEINLFLDARERQAESVSAILLASPEWLATHNEELIARVHRPVMPRAESTWLEDTVRWGKLAAGESFTLWRAQLNGGVLCGILQDMERAGYLPGIRNDYRLDELFGKPGTAVGNIVLLCAAEHAQTTGEAQWAIAQEISPHQVIVRPA